ncbi:phage portal protein [Aurantimonas sp. MSK8Z-1]|uniref:phage portal protein n=1 Tax=Mangrovibrevibacter kandeliae TaxID=2968473 RepID=UPI002118351D|nr:phage portal protein [Aurantimonas sp. MSK8Z-1]MCW4113856.1 phage portal protein [Aurantimonas sp. MSK8Z-1]
MGLRTALAEWIGAPSARPAQPAGALAARPDERKSSGLGGAFLLAAEAARWSERSYGGLARAGFLRNPIVYRCVRLLSESVAAIPPVLMEGERELTEHRLLDLLRRPHPGVDGAALTETLCGHLLLSGNAFLEAVGPEAEPRELHVLRPDRVRIVEGRDGWPEGYEYRVGASLRRLPADGADGRPGPLLHLKLFHPLSDLDGLSPLSAAQTALDLHNEAARWNKALLDNSARPSGALVYQPRDGGNLSPDQFDRLKAELDGGYTGAAGAGRPMLLEGGLDWKAMALTPKEMDFIEAKNQAAREIALAFGVPPMLLGLPGDNTYANYAEANRAFFRLAVLPLKARLTGAIGDWLGGLTGEPRLRLGYDADGIEALSAEREALWARVGAATFLSEDEKRSAVGYGRRPARDLPERDDGGHAA